MKPQRGAYQTDELHSNPFISESEICLKRGTTEPGGPILHPRARHSSRIDIQYKSENQLKPHMGDDGVRVFYYIQREGVPNNGRNSRVQSTIITNIAGANAKPISTPPDKRTRQINILYVQQGALHRE